MQRVGDGAGAVVAAVLPATVAAAPDVGGGADPVGGGDHALHRGRRVRGRDHAGAEESRLAGGAGFVFRFARDRARYFGFDRRYGRFGDFGFEPGAGAQPALEDLLLRRSGRGDQKDRGERRQGGDQERGYGTEAGGASGHPG